MDVGRIYAGGAQVPAHRSIRRVVYRRVVYARGQGRLADVAADADLVTVAIGFERHLVQAVKLQVVGLQAQMTILRAAVTDGPP
jgi:hypothetical protein